MVGRPNNTTAELLAHMTQVLETLVQDRDVEQIEYRGFPTFTKHNPPKFEGNFDPEGAQRWLFDVERIFTTMGCYEENKVIYATYMLSEEAKDWWKFARQTLSSEEGVIAWNMFKQSFLGNFLMRDLCKQKVRNFWS